MFALTEDEEYKVQNLISAIDGVKAPIIDGDFVVFTADKSYRYVGIAFDYENYETIHPFYRNTFYDIELKPRDSILFYVCRIPDKTKEISYRLILDGIWTTDPTNPEKYYSYEADTYLSYLKITRPELIRTEEVAATGQKKNLTRFVYKGESGQKIRLGGSFTNWDSFIYTLEETSPGFYEISLCLPPGTHYYAYYKGTKSFADATNPYKAYSEDGKVASIIEVK
ncbi:MAG: glycogen-binding domain-containing protein [Treponemataceae bacterium]|nr:glycogen-binding domain-containing protein [Treponemataceae bacterium]